jgi:uncharacterized membrane protein YGL010W
MFKELARQQYASYQHFHHHKLNLWLHLLAVPLFQLGFGMMVAAIVMLQPLLLSGIAVMALSMLLQGIGHKKEQQPPLPFTGPLNVISRILLEQFYSFPRFVLSGQCFKHLKA